MLVTKMVQSARMDTMSNRVCSVQHSALASKNPKCFAGWLHLGHVTKYTQAGYKLLHLSISVDTSIQVKSRIRRFIRPTLGSGNLGRHLGNSMLYGSTFALANRESHKAEVVWQPEYKAIEGCWQRRSRRSICIWTRPPR